MQAEGEYTITKASLLPGQLICTYDFSSNIISGLKNKQEISFTSAMIETCQPIATETGQTIDPKVRQCLTSKLQSMCESKVLVPTLGEDGKANYDTTFWEDVPTISKK
ncbi:MAG: hypothetical protein ABIH53_03190 [archaeon]